jgi:DNA-binding response OmpR family regulator
MHILYVENEPDIRRLVGYVLAAAGMTVECVPDTGSALQAIRRTRPDALLLDIMLPGEDGYSFCRHLRDDPRTAGLPIVILSARAMAVEVQRGYDSGADVYLSKPFEPAALIDGIRRAVAIRRGDPRRDPPLDAPTVAT